MEDNKSMETALIEALKERGLLESVPTLSQMQQHFRSNGHTYTLNHDKGSGMFLVIHTAGRDKGYKEIAEVGRSRNPKDAIEMAEKHSKAMAEAESNPLIRALTERMKSGKESKAQRDEKRKKKETINVNPKIDESAKGDYFIQGSSLNGLPAHEYDALIKQAKDTAEKHSKHALDLKAAASKGNRGGKHATVVGGGYLKSINASQHYRMLADHLEKAKQHYHGGKTDKGDDEKRKKSAEKEVKESISESRQHYDSSLFADQKDVARHDKDFEEAVHGHPAFSKVFGLPNARRKYTSAMKADGRIDRVEHKIETTTTHPNGIQLHHILHHTVTPSDRLVSPHRTTLVTYNNMNHATAEGLGATAKESLDNLYKHATEQSKVKQEEVELNELSKETLASYAKKALRDSEHKRHMARADDELSGRMRASGRKKDADFVSKVADKEHHKANTRRLGVDKALDKITGKIRKEESEIFEASVGSHVGWNSEAGHDSGTVVKVHTEPFTVNGYTHHASKDDPQYAIKSKSGHIAYHKGAAIHSEEVVTERSADGSSPVKFNIGMQKGRHGEAVPEDDIRKAVEAHGFKIDRMRVKHPKDGSEAKAIVSTHTHHDKKSIAAHLMGMSKDLGQEAIAARRGQAGYLGGPKAKEWGGKFIKKFFNENEDMINESLSRKDYVGVAKHLHDVMNDSSVASMSDEEKRKHHDSVRSAAHILSDYFAKDNPQFDSKRFHAAAGTDLREDMINELSPDKLHDYLDHAIIDYADRHTKLSRAQDRVRSSKGKDRRDADDEVYKDGYKAAKRLHGIFTATRKLANKTVKEDVLDELSPELLGRYIRRASSNVRDLNRSVGRNTERLDADGVRSNSHKWDSVDRDSEKSDKREIGIGKATKHLIKKAIKEDELSELSIDKLGDYIRVASNDRADHSRRWGVHMANSVAGKDRKYTDEQRALQNKENKKANKRMDGIYAAIRSIKKKSIKEDEDHFQRGDHVKIDNGVDPEWTAHVFKTGLRYGGESGQHQVLADPQHQSRHGSKPVNVDPKHVSHID